MTKDHRTTDISPTSNNTTINNGIIWNYSDLDNQELIPEICKTTTTEDSNGLVFTSEVNTHLDLMLIKENARRSVYSLTINERMIFLKLYKNKNLSDKAKNAARGNPAEIEAKWMKTCCQYGLPVPKVVAWSSGEANILITESLGDVLELSDFIRDYSDTNPPTLYLDKLPNNLQTALAKAGKLVGKMHKEGLVLPDLHSGNIMLDAQCNNAFLLDLQTMKRCEAANPKTMIHKPLAGNTAMLGSEILICCGEAGLEIFLKGYLESVKNCIRFDIFLKTIKRSIDAWRVDFYKKRDKRCIRNNEFFKEVNLGNNFNARVFLKNNRPMHFSDISKETFTTQQWIDALEPLKNSRRLFSSKALTLSLGGKEISVDIEGGPKNDIMNKWQYGHSLINRHIATPWPLAIVYNDKQAVLVTEAIADKQKMKYRNILIIKPSALGDVARMIPVLTALRNKYPYAKISWIVRPEFEELIKHNPALDEIIPFDKKHLLKNGLKSIPNIIAFAKSLMQRKFDLVLDAQGLLRSGLMTHFTKAPVRIGYEKARELAWLFYNNKVDTPSIQHSNLDCWQIGLAAGIEDIKSEFGVPVNPLAYNNAKAILENNNISIEDGFIALLCGGTAAEKIWPAENYAKLADNIYMQYKLKCVLIGAGAKEEKIGNEILNFATEQNAIVNLIGKSKLDEMVAILSYAKLVIGNDSGPLHIAAAIPKPVIGIYGPTNPQVVGPYCQIDNIVEAGKDIERKGRYSKNTVHKIDNIKVSDVMEKYEILTRKIDNEKSI